jgi:hypothetical protein
MRNVEIRKIVCPELVPGMFTDFQERLPGSAYRIV